MATSLPTMVNTLVILPRPLLSSTRRRFWNWWQNVGVISASKLRLISVSFFESKNNRQTQRRKNLVNWRWYCELYKCCRNIWRNCSCPYPIPRQASRNRRQNLRSSWWSQLPRRIAKNERMRRTMWLTHRGFWTRNSHHIDRTLCVGYKAASLQLDCESKRRQNVGWKLPRRQSFAFLTDFRNETKQTTKTKWIANNWSNQQCGIFDNYI